MRSYFSSMQGMVVVHGALTHETDSADALMSLFDKGSKNRHVASTSEQRDILG